MPDDQKAPIVPRKSLRDFPGLRQRSFAEERLTPLCPADAAPDETVEKDELPADFREKITNEYRQKP